MQAPARDRVVLWLAVSSEAQAVDKVSMEQQEQLGRKWAADNNATIVKVLRVDGFSRSTVRLKIALEKFLEQGVTAYDELEKLWDTKPRPFDVLWCYSDSRLGRSISIYSHVVDNTLECGALVFRHDGGYIHPESKSMQIAFGQVAATQSIDYLKRMRKPAMDRRATEGKPVTAVDPMTHRRLRDNKGKSIGWELKDDHRYALERAADLLLEGLGWMKISKALNDEGIPSPNGRFWWQSTVRTMFYNPLTWGHSARHYFRQEGLWCFDASEPLPAGVQVTRGICDPYWVGERATAIQSELRRRIETGKGKAYPIARSAFSGLLLCATCGQKMRYQKWKGGIECYRCKANNMIKQRGYEWQPCTADVKFIKMDELISHLTPYIEDLIKHGDTSWWKAPFDDMTDRLKQLDVEIKKTETLIGGLMRQAATAPDIVQSILENEIDIASRRLATMLSNRETWSRETSKHDADAAALAVAVRGIRLTTSAAAFWRQEPFRINQALHTILGKGCYIGIEEGAVIGIVRRRG
jgi:DNA-directed RNA polymerase subunit RPC12/RpoP/DNA invertase Pin-like site-specific DNA recombinase